MVEGNRKETYNLEPFEVFIFTVPRIEATLAGMVGVTVLTGLIYYLLSQVGLFSLVEAGFLSMSLFVSTLLAGEAVFQTVEKYSRKWSYFLALVNQSLASLILITGLALGSNYSSVLWIAAGAISLNTIEVLLITTSLSEKLSMTFTSCFQGSVFLLLLYYLTDFNLISLSNLMVISSALGVVLISARLAERLSASNVEVRGFNVSSALALEEKFELEPGKRVKRPIQEMKIAKDGSEFSFLVPRLHPGLISGIGRGKMSIKINEELNESGSGFFLHAPATHKSDPASPEAIQEILSERPEVEDFSAQASEMIEKEKGDFKFFGRKYGENKRVLVQTEKFDDIEVGAYSDILEPESDLLVDCHAFEPEDNRSLRSDSVEAEKFRSYLRSFLKKLDELDQGDYRAGFYSEDGSRPLFALVEYVKGQKTRIIGYEGNNTEEVLEGLDEGGDKTLVITTDSHKDPYSMNDGPGKKDLEKAVRKANKRLSGARCGLSSNLSTPLSVLGENYVSLISGFNVAARFFIISLGLIYLYLVLGILLL
ncbi:MAG: DUF2070 family protein [Candidatus Nanohalobium sp.]